MSEDLILRLAHRLDSSDPAATAEALRGSATFQGDLAWLKKLFEAADLIQLAPVPEDLALRLDGLFDNSLRAPAPASATDKSKQTWVAVPIHDTRSDGELVGVRDASEPAGGEGWTLIYTAPTADLVIDGIQEDQNRTHLSGQVLHRAADLGPYTVAGEGIAVPILVDDHGSFDLGAFDAGSYELVLESDRVVMHWTIDLE